MMPYFPSFLPFPSGHNTTHMSTNNEEEVRHEDEDHIEDEDPDLYRCNICRSDEGDDDNPLVLCDKCSVCVHRECYGNPLGM